MIEKAYVTCEVLRNKSTNEDHIFNLLYWYIYLQLGWHTLVVVQYKFTHKTLTEQHN